MHMQPMLTQSSDLLVQILGEWHARRALHYMLAYMLTSSIILLIVIRLMRVCHKGERSSRDFASRSEHAHGFTASLGGFRHWTRLDCTPVLIGSIALGLVQLIVLGLDIASNVDWLGTSQRWPLYLPFLHLAFVSLLMQFILGKVSVFSSCE